MRLILGSAVLSCIQTQPVICGSGRATLQRQSRGFWLQLFDGWIKRSSGIRLKLLLCLLRNMVGLITSSYCNAFYVGTMQSLVMPFTSYFTGDSVGSVRQIGGNCMKREWWWEMICSWKVKKKKLKNIFFVFFSSISSVFFFSSHTNNNQTDSTNNVCVRIPAW